MELPMLPATSTTAGNACCGMLVVTVRIVRVISINKVLMNIDEMVFDNLDHLEEEVMRYSLYYNELRPHSGINHLTPKQCLDLLT